MTLARPTSTLPGVNTFTPVQLLRVARLFAADPELLVLGGYFAELGPWVADPLVASLPGRVFAPAAGGCRVEPSTLGFSAAARGGALEALGRLFDDPTAVAAAARVAEVSWVALLARVMELIMANSKPKQVTITTR